MSGLATDEVARPEVVYGLCDLDVLRALSQMPVAPRQRGGGECLPMELWLGEDELASEKGSTDGVGRLDGLVSYATMAALKVCPAGVEGGAGLLPIRGRRRSGDWRAQRDEVLTVLDAHWGHRSGSECARAVRFK